MNTKVVAAVVMLASLLAMPGAMAETEDPAETGQQEADQCPVLMTHGFWPYVSVHPECLTRCEVVSTYTGWPYVEVHAECLPLPTKA